MPRSQNLTTHRLKLTVGYRCQKCQRKQGERALNRFGLPYEVMLRVTASDKGALRVLCTTCEHRDSSHDQRVRKSTATQIEQGQLVSPLFVNG